MPQRQVEPPSAAGITSRRFKNIDYAQDKCFGIWDMGDILTPKPKPELWAVFDYWDDTSFTKARHRAGFVAGLLNGIRNHFETIDVE